MKTEIELGVLPEILKEGKAYKSLTAMQKNEHQQYFNKFSRRLYNRMRELLGPDQPKHYSSYRNWFSDPEKHVNRAFLENERKDERKWTKIVNAMHFAMTETLMEAVEETETQLARYNERNSLLNDVLSIYVNSKAA